MAQTNDVTIVLLVGTHGAELARSAHVIRAAGHEVVEATSFEDARALLSSLQPDLLITSVQLGAFNGLHLVWQRQLEQPGRPSIVTSAYADSVLESEAKRLGCPFLVAPIEPAQLLAAVRSRLETGAEKAEYDKRQWPRTQIPDLELLVDDRSATLVDVSYGGCRLRFHRGVGVPLARSLTLPIPTTDVPIAGTTVWKETANDGDLYGVAIGGTGDAAVAWRAFVDGITRRG